MPKFLIILIIGLLFESAGVVYLNKGLRQVGEVKKVSASEIWRVVKSGVTNHYIILGIFLEAIFFGFLLTLMSKGAEVSFVWPLTALGFVFTTLAGKFILDEKVTAVRWGGVMLIVLGAALITYSEKKAELKAPVTGPAAAPPVTK